MSASLGRAVVVDQRRRRRCGAPMGERASNASYLDPSETVRHFEAAIICGRLPRCRRSTRSSLHDHPVCDDLHPHSLLRRRI